MKKKRLVVLVLCMNLVLSFISAHAETMSNYLSSSEGTTGRWSSEVSHELHSSLNNVCGGDVGVYFFYTSVGMQRSMDWSDDRTIVAQVYENDYWLGSTKARQIEGHFGMSNGYYRPMYWDGYTYTKTGVIESDGVVELYLDWKVSAMPGDTSTTVIRDLLSYRFWVY